MEKLVVSIEQDDCTSCGIRPELVPRHFYMDGINIAHVKDDSDKDPNEPEYIGYAGKVLVAEGLEDAVIDAAEGCPGECIYVEAAEQIAVA